MAARSPDGSFAPEAPAAPERGVEPEPGDTVRIVAGRHRGATGILNSIVTNSTPSGDGVRVAWVLRPRAGYTPVFVHEIEKA